MSEARAGAGRGVLARIAAALAARPGTVITLGPGEPPPRRAAVAVVLHETPGAVAPSALFVKRAEYPGDPWSGHVAFPGGRAEPEDATPWDTAARETWEETGLDLRPGSPAGARLLGTLDELHPRTPALPPIVIRPHVAVVGAPGPLRLSAELAGAFWVPLDTLVGPTVDRTSTVVARGDAFEVPSFVVDGHTIWGLTERIVRQLLGVAGLSAGGFDAPTRGL